MPLRTKSIVRAAAAAALAASLAGCSLLPKEESALAPPLVKPAQENYRTVKVERGTVLKRINSVGILESVSTDVIQLTAQGGRIDKINVRSGDFVKKGDILVQLITDGLDLQLKEQELALEKAKYAYRNARLSEGSDEGAVKIAALSLDIEQMKYDRVKEQFEGKQLRSNIDGQIVFVEDLKTGDYVEPFQTMAIVADPNKLRISLRVENMTDIGEADVGMHAEITLNDKKVTGKVVQTPSSAPQTQNKELAERYSKTLYINVDNMPKGVEIGTTADVIIVTKKRENVLFIPKSGIRSYLGRTFVRVLEDGKRIREIDVEQGLTSPTAVEIITGLEEGQDVILQ